jgi:hypothetical protein
MNFQYDSSAPIMSAVQSSASNHPLSSGHLLKFLDPMRHRKVMTEHKAVKEVKKQVSLLGRASK